MDNPDFSTPLPPAPMERDDERDKVFLTQSRDNEIDEVEEEKEQEKKRPQSASVQYSEPVKSKSAGKKIFFF